MSTTFKDSDLYLPLEQVCAGFVRGERIINLEQILTQSQSVRVHSMQEKDQGKEGSEGYYFRFVRLLQKADGNKVAYKTPTEAYLKKMVNSLYSVGANYGTFYFIPLEQACDLNLNFANSTDFKGKRGSSPVDSVINSLTGLKPRQIKDWIMRKEYESIRAARWEPDYNKNAEINFSIPDRKKITVVGFCEDLIEEEKPTAYLPKFKKYFKKISNTDNVAVIGTPINIKGKKWYFLIRTLKEPGTADSSVTSSSSIASGSSIASSNSTSSSNSTMST